MSWQLYVEIAALILGFYFVLMIVDRKSPHFTRPVYYALVIAAFFMFSIFIAASGYVDPFKCLGVGLSVYAVGVSFWYLSIRRTGLDTIQGDELKAAVGKEAASEIESLRDENGKLRADLIKYERMFVERDH